jgi:membrane protease YdiL (CAAX protease family)
VLDLVILTLGFMIHLWALPYSFKNLFFDSIVRLVQLGFGVTILLSLNPSVFLPSGIGLITGTCVGIACFGFQLLWNRGVRLRRGSITKSFIASQLLILLFQVPTEEIFYRGVFFTLLATIWGPFTALLISAALSTMITVVSSRRQILWLGSGLMGLLCGLGFYWSQCIWAPVLLHVLNDFGFVTFKEQRNLFTT